MNQKINKNDFLQIVAEKTGVSIHDVEKVYETIVEEIQNITLSGKDESLTGFDNILKFIDNDYFSPLMVFHQRLKNFRKRRVFQGFYLFF